MLNVDIISELQAYPYNYFSAYLLNKYKGQEALLRLGFQFKNASPHFSLPEWFKNNLQEQEVLGSWVLNFFSEGETDAQELWLSNGFFVNGDEWFEELWIKWTNQIASVFLLYGNINDYSFNLMKGFMPSLNFIVEEFTTRKGGSNVIITYSLSQSFKVFTRSTISLEKKTYLEAKVNDHIKNCQEPDPALKLIKDFEFIDQLLLSEENIVLCIANADLIFMHENVNIYQNLLSDYLLTWAFSPKVTHHNNAVILISETSESISRHLVSQSSKLELIHLPRPKTDTERLKFIIFLHSLAKPNVAASASNRAKRVTVPASLNGFRMTPIKENLWWLAKQASGLNFIGIEDLFLQIMKSKISTNEVIKKVKGNILQGESAGVLELVSSNKNMEDIQGYAEIKKRLGKISQIIRTGSPNKLEQRIIPMGILFVGPPGTGKTVVAEAFSNECKMNFLKLGDYRSKWVGETERQLSKALDLIRSYAPVIVFIDELDQSEGSRGTSSNNDVDKRVFSKFLQFMSDTSNRGKVLWIAASNRPDLIDAALKRPGRFDLKIPFLPQNAEERQATFKRYLYGEESEELKVNITDHEWELIKSKSEDFTGAEIEEIVNSCIRKKIIEQDTSNVVLSGSDVICAIDEFINPGKKSKVFNDMIEASLADITANDLIPERWKKWENPFK